MCIGSPQGGCKPTISSNTFTGNKARYTVRAIPLHCSARRQRTCAFRGCGSRTAFGSEQRDSVSRRHTHLHPLVQKPAPGSMMQGGAIYFRYCGSKVPYLSKNTFSGNSATMFNGQIGCALLWCIQTTA